MIDFNTPVFKDLLILLKKMKNNNIFTKQHNMGPDFLDNTPISIHNKSIGERFLSEKNKVSSGKVNAAFTGMPCISKEEAHLLPFQMSWMVINPESKNKSIAADFIDMYTKDIDPVLSNDADLTISLNEEDKKYRSILERSRVCFYPDLYVHFTEIMNQFYSDTISVDEAVQKINEKAKMMLQN